MPLTIADDTDVLVVAACRRGGAGPALLVAPHSAALVAHNTWSRLAASPPLETTLRGFPLPRQQGTDQQGVHAAACDSAAHRRSRLGSPERGSLFQRSSTVGSAHAGVRSARSAASADTRPTAPHASAGRHARSSAQHSLTLRLVSKTVRTLQLLLMPQARPARTPPRWMGPVPCPKNAFAIRMPADPRPSCRQMTVAVWTAAPAELHAVPLQMQSLGAAHQLKERAGGERFVKEQ